MWAWFRITTKENHLALALALYTMLSLYFLLYRGQPMKTNLRLEDGRIGEQPEVAYHVIHTVLFGGLAMVSEGYVSLYYSTGHGKLTISIAKAQIKSSHF